MTEDWRKCVVDPVLRVLLELECSVKDRTSISPLSRAVLLGTPVSELKKYREYIDQKDDHGRTALRYAVELGSLEMIKELVDGLGANVGISDHGGISVNHVACARGDVEVVDVLLRKTAELKADKRGETPLIAACRKMNWEVVPKLVKYGVSGVDNEGRTALHWIMKGTVSITDCNEAVESLLANDVDVNAQDHNGYTALHFAAERGLSDACQLLVKRGARLSLVDKNGETALHKSVSRPTILQGKTCTLQILIDLKSDVTVRRLDGKTADDLIVHTISTRSWTDAQKITFEVARRRLAKAIEDMQKV